MSFPSVHSSSPWMLLTAQNMAQLFTTHPSCHATVELPQSTGEFCATKLHVCRIRMLVCTHYSCEYWHCPVDLQLLWRSFAEAAEYLVHELPFILKIHYDFQYKCSCYSGKISDVICTFIYFIDMGKLTIWSFHRQDTALPAHPPQTQGNYHNRAWCRAQDFTEGKGDGGRESTRIKPYLVLLLSNAQG